jgi:hypothetical protein
MRFRVRCSLFVVIGCATLAGLPSAAQAIEPPTFGVERLFAANCEEGHEECGEHAEGPKTVKEAEESGFREAGGFVPFGVSDFVLKTVEPAPGLRVPVESVKNLRFDAGPGVVTSPVAVGFCSQKNFKGEKEVEPEPGVHLFTESRCPASTIIGKNEVETVFPKKGGGFEDKKLSGLVYNLDPENGVGSDFGVALFITEPAPGFRLYAHTHILGNVEWATDYHDYYETKNITPGLIESRLVLKGNEDGNEEPTNFIRNPSACGEKGPATRSTVSVESYAGVKAEAAYEDLLGANECEEEKFEPSFKLTPNSAPESTLPDKPDGVIAELTAAHPEKPAETDTSDLKSATVTLPVGMSLNESAVAGLEGCTHEQIGIGTRNPTTCPARSQIGTVSIETPTLPPGQLKGPVYLGRPATGAIEGPPFTIYLDAESARYGVKVRLEGTVQANPETGQLTTTFSKNPEAPFNSVTVSFFGGPHAPLSNALSCTGGFVQTAFAPFSGTETMSGKFPFNPEGCPPSPPFSLTQATTSQPPTGGANTIFKFVLNRSDGNQFPAKISTVLPAGLVGRIPAASQCPEANAKSETEPCPASSRLGSVRATVGTGPEPFTFTGSAYLTGPYASGPCAGAPYGLAFKVPIVAGPINFGTEVRCAKIQVDPHTARVIVSAELPRIRRGVLVHLRSLAVTVNRPGFMLNPTSCAALATESSLTSTIGGLANVASPLQTEGCNLLPFKPSFSASTGAKTSKANGASLEVKMSQGPGQANIRSVQTSLPIALPSRLTTLQKACLEATFAGNPLSCPEASNVGTATAVTPVLPNPMSGPAYLVSHGGAAFPDLDLVLEGNNGIRIILVGNTDIKKGITTTTFAATPDVPVSSFVLKLPTGPHSALAAFGNLCTKKLVMPTTIVGQNGAQIKQNTIISVTGCPVRIVSRRVSHNTAVLRVQVFEAGRIKVGGKSLKGVSQRVTRAGTATVKVPLSAGGRHRHRPFKTRVHVSFLPAAKGAARSSTSTLVRFH